MMQHYSARQREKDLRWDYTVGSSPVGYCLAYQDTDEMGVPMNPNRAEVMRQFKDKHHTHGHETAEEACECYKQYLLDQRTRHSDMSNQMLRCEICGEFTQHVVYIGAYEIHKLCVTHATREFLEQVVTVGESWES
jgi:hypothetical protein